MEERKLIKFGNSSCVVTLPNEWLKQNNLDKGDEVVLCSTKDKIVLSIKKEIQEKKATLNLDSKPLKLFNKELISYYLKNFKFIEITGENILDKLEQIKIFKEKLSSVEIVEMNSQKVVLKDLSAPSELKLYRIIGDIVSMQNTIFEELIKEEKIANSKKHRLIAQLDSNINKMTFLSYKAINYNLETINDPENIKNGIYLWRIVSSFEQIGDIVKRIARYLENESNEQNHFIQSTLLDVKNYYEFITGMVNKEINLDTNLKLYLDKKQSLLREVENLRDKLHDDLNLFLVVSQLLKDIIGQLDTIILSIIDINS